ncbi:hypothetical protein PybrP1_009671 [[Pythium] brassicae (nom. inval.)]|nr:hypothetical protein PybrP1_009671 [[Pythium] brassicae (nom. inval.)]
MDVDTWVNGVAGAALNARPDPPSSLSPPLAASDPAVAPGRRSTDFGGLLDAAWGRTLGRKPRSPVAAAAAPDREGSQGEGITAQLQRRSSAGASPPPSPLKNAMSVLVPAADGDLLTALDPRFFTESFDAVAHMLNILPTDPNELDAFLRAEISAVDVAKDVIVAKLADDVRANQDAFIQGMKQVQEVDLDLVRAQIHVKNGRRLLMSAKNDLIISSLAVVKIKRNRDRVEEASAAAIINHGNQVLHFFEEEQRMNHALQTNSFTTAVDICVGLRKQLATANLEKSLRKVAEHFDPLQYKELLHAYITLAEHSENLGFEFSSNSLSEVLASIPEIVVRCIDDITRQFMAELFKQKTPTRSKESGKKKRSGTPSKKRSAKSSSKSASSALSTAAKAIDDVKNGFERLADLMHTYYLLVQWHRDPFNPRNDSLEYLHRCGIDDDDDDDDDDDFNEENERRNSEAGSEKGMAASLRKLLSPRTKRSSSVSSESSATPQRSPYSQILCETGMTLLRYRKIVWENMQQNVVEVLDRLDMTYGFKMEHIIALSHATNVFVEIGEEFTGAATTKLRSCIRTKCEQYLNALHDDNIELMRMLLDTENWQRVVTYLEDGDDDAGLLRLIEKRSGYLFAKKAREEFALNPIYTRRVFPSFHREGNPFNATNSSGWLSLENGIRFQYETRPSSAGTGRQGPGAEGDQDADGKDGDDSQGLPPFADEPELVLNSSTLSGYIRFCGVYLKMMEHLPTIAWDILLMLNRIFEFYAYAVFTSFADRDNICRIADEIHAGETYLQASVVVPAGVGDKSQSGGQQPVQKTVALRRISRIPAALEEASESNLFSLAERCVACEVVCAQVRLLKAIEATARSYLPERYHCLMDDVYARNTVLADELRRFMYQSVAAKLVDAPSLLRAIRQVSWDLADLRERPNDYVVVLVQKCGEAWGGLQIVADGAIPAAAREEIWSAMVQTIMETLLSGFSEAPRCTPQGRALMSMDVLALQNGLDLINHVSVSRDFVTKYLKAFFYDDAADLLAWIKDNKDAYSKLQFVNLIKNGVGPKMDKTELRAFVLQVDDVLSA